MQFLLLPFVRRTPFALFILAVTLIAWIANRRTAILMSVVGILATDYLFIEPTERTWHTHALGVMFVFCIVIIVISVITSMNTEIARRKQEIARRKQLEEQQKVFVATLGHDLRNPLSAVKMAAQALIVNDKCEPTQLTASRIVRVANRLGRLIDHLLDYSRCDITGKFPIYRERTNMKNILGDLINEISPEDTSRIDYTCDDVEGEWDPDRVCQMAQNLLANALDHGDPNKKITVRGFRRDGAAFICISNRITEPVPQEKVTRLFEPFSSSGRKRTGTRSTGLGLFIARQIALAHGGSISADIDSSDLSITVALPCHVPRSSDIQLT